MSEPWIRFYDADVRGDPKIIALRPAMRWALVIAWGLAKNGPGEVHELRSSDGSVMGLAELRRLASVDPNETRAMFQRWASNGLCELVETTEGQLCTFPKLASRQGIDASNAQRQRRFRERHRNAPRNAPRNAEVTPLRNGPVTAQSTDNRGDREDPSIEGSSLSAPPQKPRPRDLLWDALVEGCGYSPGTHTERGAWNKARKEIADQSPDAVTAKAAEFKRRYPDLRCTPTALVRQWGALGEANGKPKRTMEEVERLYAEYTKERTP